MSDQPGQNGVLDLGDVGDTSLDKVDLPHPANFVKTGVPVLPGHTYAVLSAAFTPDGQRLLVAHGHGVRQWDVASGQEIIPAGTQPTATKLAVSTDGRLVAAGSAAIAS